MTSYYLLHATNQDYTKIDKLIPAGTSLNELKDQFPGVYFSLITSENIETELLFAKKNYLLFPLDLLQQKNFHINIRDMNGIINEHNTFFYWQLNDALQKISEDVKEKQIQASIINNQTMNEVIFHDSIDMKHLCKVVVNNMDRNVKHILPREQLYSNFDIDTSLLPFYGYYNEKFYTGIYPPKKSSQTWIDKMHSVCDINIQKGFDAYNEYDEFIYYTRAQFLYYNRHEQKLSILTNAS